MNITGGKYNGRKVIAPDENITRPTLSKVRMSVFNTLYSMIDFEGASFLDMFGGSGIMSLEAYSRGFTDVVCIEKNVKALNVIKSNFNNFSDSDIKLLKGDSLKICKKLNDKFDVIYIDPPYFSGVYENCLDVVKHISNIVVLEHVTDVKFNSYEVLKQKKYGDKFITFLKYNQA